MAELYGRDYKTIAKHINNALREELEGEPVVAKFATTKNYGRVEGFTQEQAIEYFNLDMIISVGYRVKSKQGVLITLLTTMGYRHFDKFEYQVRKASEMPSSPLV